MSADITIKDQLPEDTRPRSPSRSPSRAPSRSPSNPSGQANAQSAKQFDEQFQTHAWYRYKWPWFLISFPLISVCLGMVMLYLAFNANNSLVVDDYYKEGKAYNLIVERDQKASLLGVSAEVSQSTEGIFIDLFQISPVNLPSSLVADAKLALESFQLPDAIQLRWVHVTQAERDGEATLQFIGGDRYIAQGSSLPEQGKFRLHIQPATSADNSGTSWRLISLLTGFNVSEKLVVNAPALNRVFSSAVLTPSSDVN